MTATVLSGSPVEGDGSWVEALASAHGALDGVATHPGGMPGWASAEVLSAEELAEAVRLVAALEARVAGVRLHLVAAAQATAAATGTGAADVEAWAAAAAGRNRSRSWASRWLAERLDAHVHVRAGLAAGTVTEEQARIIVAAAESVPAGVDPVDLARCEEQLVAAAVSMPPRRLRQVARRLLEPLGASVADAHEAQQLVAEERRAENETWLQMEDAGDGTWRGRFCLPELHALALKHVLDRLTAPRRAPGAPRAGTRSHEAPGPGCTDRCGPDDLRGWWQHTVDCVHHVYRDPTLPGDGETLTGAERLGAALMELIEHMPTEALGGSGFAVVVHVEEERLRDELGAASLDTGIRVSAGQARRLACNAGILPLVLGGATVPINLGRSARLFSRAQAIALSARHDQCVAEGCDRPFAWCELHHLKPWSHAGPTDLANAVPLCGHHHRRIHDPLYEHHLTPDGQLRFAHRWASRRQPTRAA